MSFIKTSSTLCLAALLGACSTPSPQSSSPPASPPPAATTASSASAAPAAAKPTQNLVDPAAVQALKDMGATLQSLRRYDLSLDLSGERVLQDGQKLMHTAHADLNVAQPNRIRVTTATATSRRVLTFDGKKVSLLYPGSNYYSQADFSGTVGELIQRLRTNYNIEFPAADLFVWGTPAAPFSDLQSAMNAGQAVVLGKLCDQYAFRQPGIDWQIWLTTGPNPLPMRLVVTNLEDDARPQSITQFHWNLKPTFQESAFNFVAPRGATSVNMVPVKKQ